MTNNDNIKKTTCTSNMSKSNQKVRHNMIKPTFLFVYQFSDLNTKIGGFFVY